MAGVNQDLAELLSGQACPLAINPQSEEAVAILGLCELQSGLLESVRSDLELHFICRSCWVCIIAQQGKVMATPPLLSCEGDSGCPGVAMVPQCQSLVV